MLLIVASIPHAYPLAHEGLAPEIRPLTRLFQSRIVASGRAIPYDAIIGRRSHRHLATLGGESRGASMIDVVGVTHHYGVRPVLRDISVHIPTGQLVALMGPNGMGK